MRKTRSSGKSRTIDLESKIPSRKQIVYQFAIENGPVEIVD